MITQEVADRILHQILEEELVPSATRWRDTFTGHISENDTIDQGLTALAGLLPENDGDDADTDASAECVLFGWIDQAVLEIIATGSLASLHDRALNYRAEQCGDTGILTLIDGIVTVLEFSFEIGEATIREYRPAEPT